MRNPRIVLGLRPGKSFLITPFDLIMRLPNRWFLMSASHFLILSCLTLALRRDS
jgi:hypothetical protein